MQFQKVLWIENSSLTTPVKWNFELYNLVHSQTSFIFHNWNTKDTTQPAPEHFQIFFYLFNQTKQSFKRNICNNKKILNLSKSKLASSFLVFSLCLSTFSIFNSCFLYIQYLFLDLELISPLAPRNIQHSKLAQQSLNFYNRSSYRWGIWHYNPARKKTGYKTKVKSKQKDKSEIRKEDPFQKHFYQ